MEIKPTREEFEQLAGQGNVVPVYADWLADFETPVSAYVKLRNSGPSFLFESVEGGENLNRYTFIGCRPRKVFACGPEKTIVQEQGREDREIDTPADPLQVIEEEMAGYRPVELPDMPRFTGGAVGFLSYEYIHRIDPEVPVAKKIDVSDVPLIYFMLVDSVLIFDRAKQTMRICVNAHIEGDPGEAYEKAVREVREISELLAQKQNLGPMPLIEPAEIAVPKGNFTPDEFKKLVVRAKEFLDAGEVIQVVVSQRFAKPFTKTPLDLYRALRTVNPSPYMFLIEIGDLSIVGASPEVHVRLTDRLVELRPIAGTRRRGATVQEDLLNEKDLLADEKERAEHLMLVDLARNDIEPVCEPGSVHVPEHMVIERYSHVMHIVSQVEGTLRKDANAYDVMRATFPAGTVSGAPKTRAMQIISEQEETQRGVYAGALGYLSYDGNLDSCITIRTALLKDGMLYVQSGAGIVADSVPENEYWETINKAQGMMKAVAIAEEIPDRHG
ncbi:MAG TPA: anthranilate synthase component I [Opitutales bacterium]|nr:anthranilate synthase component I [Opitutales bacterium]